MLQYVFILAVKTYGTHFVAAVANLYAAYKHQQADFVTIFEHLFQNHQAFRGKIMLCCRREKCGKLKLMFPWTIYGPFFHLEHFWLNLEHVLLIV